MDEVLEYASRYVDSINGFAITLIFGKSRA
jgi:hypothetical protein